jgi:HSP20 family molecular chaperone IbpA
MSDAVRASSNNHRQHMNNIHKAHKREIDLARGQHDANLSEINKAQDAHSLSVRQKHAMDIAEASQKKEEALQQLKSSVDKAQRLTEAELKQQKAQLELRRTVVEDNFQKNLGGIQERQQAALEDVNLRFRETAQNQNSKSNQIITAANDAHRAQVANEKEVHTSQLHRQRDHFQNVHTAETDKFQSLLDKQQHQGKHQLKTAHLTNEKRLTGMNKEHVAITERVRTEQAKALVDKQAAFEAQYAQQAQKHLASQELLEGLNTQAIQKGEEAALKRINAAKERTDDQFFEFTELRPTLEEKLDSYVLKIKIPEYAKEEVMLTANPKEMVLTSNRRHRAERKDEDGTIRKVDKVESLVSRIPVGSVLDAKKMTKTYEDGTLTFVVKKA